MSVELNHTIVSCRSKQKSATFLAAVLGLPAPTRFGPVPRRRARQPRLARLLRDRRRDLVPALRLPGRRGRLRRGLCTDPRARAPALGRSRQGPARRNQPQRRRPRRVLRRPRRSSPRDHHPALRQRGIGRGPPSRVVARVPFEPSPAPAGVGLRRVRRARVPGRPGRSGGPASGRPASGRASARRGRR